MISKPVAANPFVQKYLSANKSVVGFNLNEERDDFLDLSFILDYHNFAILATTLGRRFQKAGYPEAVREGITIFSETLRENVLSVALRRFYEQMKHEKMNGPLAEMYEACETHLITLDDLLRLNFKASIAKLKFHGGKKALDVFDEYMRKMAAECEIHAAVTITPEKWDMHFDYQNVRSLFFQAPATPMLFTRILTPVMLCFYESFQL